MNSNLEKTNFTGNLYQTISSLKKVWLKIKPAITPEKMDQEQLLNALDNAKYELDVAYINFDYAYNKDLVNVCTYNLKAAQANYNYLTKLAKIKICS